jgi:molecular chaperone DnaJ
VLSQRESPPPDASARGADLHLTLPLSFEAAIRGGEHAGTVTRQEQCPLCDGHCRARAGDARCAHCHGAGTLRTTRGHMVFSKPCASCGGTGRQPAPPCPACGGQGVEMRTERLTMSVPPGLADGARIRLGGKGHAGRGGGDYGDLYITLNVAPHPFFRREGDDLHIVVPVAIHEAALGARIDVPSFDGLARVRVPPGTQSGQRFRLRERGVPSPRDGRRGDLIVELRLVLPAILDERSKELLKEFGRINAEDVRAALNHHRGHKGHGDANS